MNHKTVGAGNLIKKDGRRASPPIADNNRKVIKNQIINARAEAERIITEAEAFAAETHRKVLAESEHLRDRAYQAGLEKALEEFEENLLAAHEIRDRALREIEQDLLRLAVRLAEKIIGSEINKDDQIIVNIVAAALQNARQQEKLTVRVNPANLTQIESEIKNFASGGRTRFLDFIADPRVSVGGCMIESEVGTIDARLETQLRVLERALLAQSEGEGKAE